MSDEVLIAELWRRLGPLLPPRPRRFRYPGRHAVNDWVVLAGIVWVLRHDVRWRQLPTSFGVSAVTCAVTCWRRLRDWQAAGVWQKLHEALLADLTCTPRSSTLHHVHALKGGKRPVPARSTEGMPAQNII